MPKSIFVQTQNSSLSSLFTQIKNSVHLEVLLHNESSSNV